LAGKPILIDTLSFEKYSEGSPWIAYRQFCQHFLAPLALMAKVDIRLSNLLTTYLDGIPLDLAAKLLPLSTKLNLGLLTHIHLHASSQKNYSSKIVNKQKRSFSKKAFLGLLSNLEGTIGSLKWEPQGTEWADYYPSNNNYVGKALSTKAKLVEKIVEKEKPKNVWDIGGNTGLFSRVASDKGIETLSFDIDPAAVEINYRMVKERGEKNLLPLLLDLTNPAPGIGWKNRERDSFLERGPADMILALALVHHLTISNNLPLDHILGFFSEFGRSLVIEFVPKEDSQVKKLLSSREDIFPEYNQKDFEKIASKYFTIANSFAIASTKRTLYFLKSKAKRK
jgi:ribosomal protein L11 methylase PrmA